MSKELPGEWGKRLGPKGIHSYRDLAAAADIPPGTAHRLVNGPTSAATVNKVADIVFDGDRDLVWRLRGSSRRDFGDWDLPDGATLLNEEQRAAVRAVIQAMVPAEQEELMGNAEHPAPTKLPVPQRVEPVKAKAARKTARPTAEQRAAEAERHGRGKVAAPMQKKRAAAENDESSESSA